MTTEATLSLAQALLACPSVTPADGGSLELIKSRLAPLGFSFEAIDRGRTRNLWARRGTAKPLFCFAGHVDVVPTGPLEQWTSPPFEPEIRDGYLYGRGAADMKSSIAAMIVAVERFVAAHPEHPGSIAFLITSDEEGDALDGTVAVVETLQARSETLDYCIIGEPTSVHTVGDMVKNGRRGSLSGKLKVKGIQCHIAYPDKGRNPIHQLAPALTELAATTWDEGNEYFQPTTWQVSNIHAGTGANNVVPAHVELLFNFRFSTASTPESLQQRFTALLDRHGLEYEISWTLGARPFLTGRGVLADAVSAAIQAETGLTTELSTTGGTSDGRFIAAICPQMVEVGPVNATSHKIDECIAVDALPRLTGIYQRILEQILHV
ncbi:succinyl-diaminopimelate desuccinylase [Azovibrio restrictus]|uniref:succinyl-diaminopimelate desuccinylase n=1 Tax=Azovibrio restrictus TaxID=146938 RepID=UPI000414A0D1|nr:succinyl-diaminopimelate desuccinylase [Azovibrio restrictus]